MHWPLESCFYGLCNIEGKHQPQSLDCKVQWDDQGSRTVTSRQGLFLKMSIPLRSLWVADGSSAFTQPPISTPQEPHFPSEGALLPVVSCSLSLFQQLWKLQSQWGEGCPASRLLDIALSSDFSKASTHTRGSPNSWALGHTCLCSSNTLMVPPWTSHSSLPSSWMYLCLLQVL